MSALSEIAPAFIEMAHRIVWCSAATVDKDGHPRQRILHPIWQWDGQKLVGWVATSPTPIKSDHLKRTPYLSVNYWDPTHDTCAADCRAVLLQDDETRTRVWNLFANGPAPVGYDPKVVAEWTSPTVEAFAVLRLEPFRIRFLPGTWMQGQGTRALKWKEA